MYSVQLPAAILKFRMLVRAAAFFMALLTIQTVHSQTLPDKYDFNLGVTYETSSGKNGSFRKGEQMGLWFSKGEYAGMESPKQKGFFMVMDVKDQKMITLMTDQKMAMVMDLAKMKEKMKTQQKEEDQADVKVTKTGKTATILGYKCEEYQVDSESSTALVWITKELGDGMGNLAKNLSTMFNAGPKSMGMPSMKGMESGVMLKMESTDKKSGNSTKLEALSVSKDGKIISTSGYNVMAMPGM